MLDEKALMAQCVGYLPITKAPSLTDLKDRAEASKRDLEDVLADEREILYSSSDDKNNIWLIMNPAVWPTRVINQTNGSSLVSRCRPAPQQYSGGQPRKNKQLGI